MDAPYPPWVAAKQPASLRVADVLAVHRDYYQGTPYDLSNGLASGPWGTPNRFMFPAAPFNAWERPISLYRTAVSYVAQSRPAGSGTVWFGPHAPHGTIYVPLSPRMSTLPAAYGSFDVTSGALDRRGAYWAHVATQAVAEGRFSWVQPEVAALPLVFKTNKRDCRSRK